MRKHMQHYIESGTSGAARSVRILAEYMSALEKFERLQARALVTVFGSARLGPDSTGCRLADELARGCVARGYGVVTGGSSGVMLAANRAAMEEAVRRGLPVEDHSIGCAINLPFEESGRSFLGTQTDFHYFFIRKFFLVAYSKAFFFLEGGGGTRDELWEVFCLIQTGKMPIHPLVAVGSSAVWRTIQADLDHMVERGTISPADRSILRFAPSAEAALDIVDAFYSRIVRVGYDKKHQSIDFHLRDRLTISELNRLKRRFGPVLNGLEWLPEQRCLRSSQFNFRSYGTLYEMVAALSAAGQSDERFAAGEN